MAPRVASKGGGGGSGLQWGGDALQRPPRPPTHAQAHNTEMAAPSSTVGEVREWMVKNKLKAVLSVWATGLGASLAWQWTRPIPTQLKVIHARVYAQV